MVTKWEREYVFIFSQRLNCLQKVEFSLLLIHYGTGLFLAPPASNSQFLIKESSLISTQLQNMRLRYCHVCLALFLAHLLFRKPAAMPARHSSSLWRHPCGKELWPQGNQHYFARCRGEALWKWNLHPHSSHQLTAAPTGTLTEIS